MKIRSIKSIWIIFVLLLVATILLGMFSQLLDVINGKDNWTNIFQIGILGSLFSFFFYGILFWPPVLLLMLLCELGFLNKDSSLDRVKKIYILELLIISIPFSVWAVTENYPSWFYFIGVLLLGQVLRLRALK